MSTEFTLTACGSKIGDRSIYRDYKDQRIYFCEKECAVEFDEDPVKFIISDHWKLKLIENDE